MARTISTATLYAKAHDATFRAGLAVTRFKERKTGALKEWDAKIKYAEDVYLEAIKAEKAAKHARDGTTAEAPKA